MTVIVVPNVLLVSGTHFISPIHVWCTDNKVQYEIINVGIGGGGYNTYTAEVRFRCEDDAQCFQETWID